MLTLTDIAIAIAIAIVDLVFNACNKQYSLGTEAYTAKQISRSTRQPYSASNVI